MPSPVRASSRTEADFFPLDGLARAAALIDDTPENLVVAMNSMSRPPARKSMALRPLILDCLRRPGMTANRRFDMRATCHRDNGEYQCSIPQCIFTSCNRADSIVSSIIHIQAVKLTLVVRTV